MRHEKVLKGKLEGVNKKEKLKKQVKEGIQKVKRRYWKVKE